MKGKHIHKFTISVIAMIFFLFFVYWSYIFGIFSPAWGTSGTSISALWGQLLVGFMATFAVCSVLFIIDLRQAPVKFYKLISLYVLVAALALTGFSVWKEKVEYGVTHTYTTGQEFSYLQYKFTINPTFQNIPLRDCTGLSEEDKFGDGIWSGYRSASDKSICEDWNTNNSSRRRAVLNVTVGNTQDKFNFFGPAWFEITTSTGEKYKVRFIDSGDSNPNQVPPNGQITPALATEYDLGQEEAIYSIKLKIDDHAEQIIKSP